MPGRTWRRRVAHSQRPGPVGSAAVMAGLALTLFWIAAVPSQDGTKWIDPGFGWAAGILDEQRRK